jgi:hypothetical protein
MKANAVWNDGMENCHMAEQDYHMDHASERQREIFGEDKPSLWLLTCPRPCQTNINAISLLLALSGFTLTSELVLLRLEPNMPGVSSARALTNVSQGLYKLTSPFPFGGYTDSPKQLHAL